MPDSRRPRHNERCNIADVVKSAFGVFFFQRQSMLDYQRRMKEQHGRNNLETVFGVTALPYGRSSAKGTGRSGAGAR
ncbi:MAG: hypothetical protein LBF87_04600 [Treponema sp.]|nr:hypothetical protein [Treponema sp.]